MKFKKNLNIFNKRFFNKNTGGDEPLIKENNPYKNTENIEHAELPSPTPTHKKPTISTYLPSFTPKTALITPTENKENDQEIVLSDKEPPLFMDTYPDNDNMNSVSDSSTSTMTKHSTRKSMEEIKNILLSKYTYIEDDQLSKRFDLCNKSNTKHVHFCVYSINIDCYIEGISKPYYKEEYGDIQYNLNEFYPFLEFVVQENAESYSFPKIEYECPEIANTDKNYIEDDNSQDQIYFENFCKENILSLFNNSYIINKIDLKALFKGFIEDDDDNLYVFFDATSVIDYLKENYILAVIDELVYKKEIYSKPVDSQIVSFFKKNDDLIHIMTKEGKRIPFPFQLYICKDNDGEYENIRTTEPTLKMMDHSFFNMAYYFTSNPIVNNDTKGFRRFACFIFKALYILKDIEIELTEEEKDNYEDKIIEASTIYFHENGLQLWALKNILHFAEY